MLFENRHHIPQDYQSLLLHKEAVAAVRMDPGLKRRLLETLDRWESRSDASSKPLRDVWREIIQSEDWDRAVEESERGNQLRQASPMATILPNETRYRIIQHVRQLKDSCREKV